ncbi:MAG: twin-arginine translocase TatA/TatE family subunit [Acidobacteriota bacterium]
MGPLGFQELLIVLFILVLLFGATKLPQIGRGLGEGIRNFKRGVREPEPDKIEDGDEAAKSR